MAISGVNYEQLKKMQQTFEAAVGEAESGKIYDQGLKECGKKHLARVIQNTPFGKYPATKRFVYVKHGGDGKPFVYCIEPKLGGTLRKGWVVDVATAESSPGTPSSAEVRAKVKNTPIETFGEVRRMTFYNYIRYANWVDKGHRLCHPKGMQYGYVVGKHFIGKSEKVTAIEMPLIIEKHMARALKKRGIG